jgi:hypothetical protein
VSFTGNNLENAPENSFVTTFNLTLPAFGDTDWFIEGDGSYTDERFTEPDNNYALEDYWMFNFRAGLSGDRWSAVAYVNNAFDDTTVKSGLGNIDSRYIAFDAGVSPAGVLVPSGARFLLPDPRTYGVRVTYRFGE